MNLSYSEDDYLVFLKVVLSLHISVNSGTVLVYYSVKYIRPLKRYN